MSQPSLVSQPAGTEIPAQKQRANIYTVMLIISFICILTATLLLYFELERWGDAPWWNTDAAKPTGAWLIHPPASDSGQATFLV